MDDEGFTLLQEGGVLGVIWRPDDPTPVGAVMQGDFTRLRGKVVRVRSKGMQFVNLVTDVRYVEGETYLSFRDRRPA